MTTSTAGSNLGRQVFGVATLTIGLITLAWHDYNDWLQLRFLVYVASAAQIAGGAAIQFRRTAKTGAIVLGAGYLGFVFLCLPAIVTAPLVYNSWGNFFEQFSLLTGAAIVYGRLSSAWAHENLNRIARILLGVCTVSFTLEQTFHLSAAPILFRSGFLPVRCFGR
jgi:hypothetical protein